MNCKRLEELLSAYADGEADALRTFAVERHVQGCGRCTASYRELAALRARIRTEVPRHVAPPALHARVRALTGAVQAAKIQPAAPTRDRWRWLTGGMVAGALASIVAWTFGTTLLASLETHDFANAAVAMHVQASLNDHLIDVASSDRHTVRPYLSARLDYAPPVRDLAAEGFPLVGGRVERFDDAPLAALVYRHGQHTIDVFVRPQTASLGALPSRVVRGFNVARASGGGMEWCAVSDAEPAVVSAFVRRLAQETPAQ
jgi:anti-sigma factor RsiW